MIIGLMISWGILWPFFQKKKGEWYNKEFNEINLHSLQGYKVYSFIALNLGDACYQFIKMLCLFIWSILKKRERALVVGLSWPDDFDRERRNLFIRDYIPRSYIFPLHFIILLLSVLMIPHIFPVMKWYDVLIFCVVTPLLVIPSSFAYGISDWSITSTSGRLSMFLIGVCVSSRWGGCISWAQLMRRHALSSLDGIKFSRGLQIRIHIRDIVPFNCRKPCNRDLVGMLFRPPYILSLC